MLRTFKIYATVWMNLENIMLNKEAKEKMTSVCFHLFETSRIGKHHAAAKSLQSCPTLCDPRDGSPPGSSVPGILQARTLEWVAISFSSAWKWKVKVKSLSCVRLLATPWTAAYQAPLAMQFSRQEYWSGLPVPSPPIAETHTNIKDLTHENVCQIAQRFHVVRFRPIRVMRSHIFDRDFCKVKKL